MLKLSSLSIGSFYCVLGIGLVVLSKQYPEESFDLVRGKLGDQFANPQCTNGSCVSACHRYNAVCSSNDCEHCVCNAEHNKSMTYLASYGSADGRCLQDSVIARNSGCSNSHAGYLINTLDTDCGKDCVHKVKILSQNVSPNTKCILGWARSSFSINNQPWKLTGEFANDFELADNNTSQSKELYIKLNEEAYKRWTGSLMKLQINCCSSAIQFNSAKHFCVILKFTGKYKLYEVPPTPVEVLTKSTTNTTIPTPRSEGMLPRPGDQYLASTIALSAILFIVFVLLGIGIFHILRRHERQRTYTMDAETMTIPPENEEQTEWLAI